MASFQSGRSYEENPLISVREIVGRISKVAGVWLEGRREEKNKLWSKNSSDGTNDILHMSL